MHPKNSTTASYGQQMLTVEHSFHCDDGAKNIFFKTVTGPQVAAALNEASCLLSAANSLLSKLMDDGLDGNDAFGIRFLVAAGKALVDSSACAAESFDSGMGGQA